MAEFSVWEFVHCFLIGLTARLKPWGLTYLWSLIDTMAPLTTRGLYGPLVPDRHEGPLTFWNLYFRTVIKVLPSLEYVSDGETAATARTLLSVFMRKKLNILASTQILEKNHL